jgi:hypothetical protein
MDNYYVDRVEPILKEFGFKQEKIQDAGGATRAVRNMVPDMDWSEGKIYAAWSKGNITLFCITGINKIDWHKGLNNVYFALSHRQAQYAHFDFVFPIPSAPSQELVTDFYTATKLMLQYALGFYSREDMGEYV